MPVDLRWYTLQALGKKLALIKACKQIHLLVTESLIWAGCAPPCNTIRAAPCKAGIIHRSQSINPDRSCIWERTLSS